jgi:hypothetical protein
MSARWDDPELNRQAAIPDERHVIVEDEALAAGFTQIPNQVLRRADLPPGAKLTYMVLLSYAWQKDSCYPGQDRLAVDMGVSERSVVTYLKQLQTAGLVTVRRRGLGLTNVYVLHRISGSANPAPQRSAKSAELELQVPTEPEVQDLQAKKTHREEDPDEEDSSNHSKELHIIIRQEDAERIAWYIQDLGRELHDQASAKASASRACRLYAQSGLSLDAFLDLLQTARVRTQRYSASIKAAPAKSANGWGAKPKMAYFFAVLEDLVQQQAARPAS